MSDERTIRAPERFSIAATAGRWIAFLDVAHDVLVPPSGFARDGDDLLVYRERPRAAPIAGARVPRPFRAALLLQAASAAAFSAACGFPLTERDLDEANWGREAGVPLLWLLHTPDAVAAPGPPRVAAVLAHFLHALFGERITDPRAKRLEAPLRAPGADEKRGEFWVAGVLRAFPELARPEAAGARRRCIGRCGPWRREPAALAAREKARAILEGAEPRVFLPGASPLTPGGALGLSRAPASPERAARVLRERAAGEAGGRRIRWIAVAPERWDALSRAAFAAARLALGAGIECVEVPGDAPAPESADEWRGKVWIPCGTVAGAVRQYEWLAEAARRDPARAASLPERLVSSPEWVPFAADPTGDAPLPGTNAISIHEAHGSPRLRRRGRPGTRDRGRRIELLAAGGRIDAALEEARRWIAAGGDGAVGRWFGLAAFLAARVDGRQRVVPWLEAIEAEREIAGGRAQDAAERLARLARAAAASAEERRTAELRLAEVTAVRGSPGEASRRAATWRRAHPAAPAAESVRALRLGALGLSREGRTDCALGLLDEADALCGPLPAAERLEVALVRAQVFSAARRFDDEAAVYDGLRDAACAQEDAIASRFLAQEARGLLDRREYARATIRFEEALAAARDDPAERAALLLDLAATRYHAGDAARAEALLAECLAAAEAGGREDLGRIARGNRIELLVNRRHWPAAEAEIAVLEASARSDRDDVRLLVALHHRSRLALRRGRLDAAGRDNAEARRIAAAIGDRLEIGELWLEEGDRLLYEGNRAAAEEAWRRAAEEPRDRSARDRLAAGRLAELEWSAAGAPPAEALAEIETAFCEDGYRAAETVARWVRLLPRGGVPWELCARAERVLRDEGGDALAERVFGDGDGDAELADALRAIRSAVAGGLDGDDAEARRALSRLGIAGLCVRDPEGRELVRLETPGTPASAGIERTLDAGSARLLLSIRPAVPDATARALALLLETLLFRATPPGAPSGNGDGAGWSAGWRRLGVVTADASMEEPYRRLLRFAPQNVTVLVLGESGCGKEAVARALHRLSPRSRGPFVAVNVPAIPAGLTETELFGHARGAFTGADRERRGLLEEASGGTIFFDEVGDLATPLQAKLLRTLQEREVRRVGENRARPIDVRVVSATSRDLSADVESGRFREDLYYRLHVAIIRLPPLRERGRDAVLLARHFVDRFAREYGRGDLRLTPAAAARIAAARWPGNVRELQNAVAQAVALSEPGGAVGEEALPESIAGPGRSERSSGDYRARVDAHRRDLIADALDRAGGNRTRAARDLGLSRQALLYLIKELKVERPRT